MVNFALFCLCGFLCLRCDWVVSVYTTCIRRVHPFIFWRFLLHVLVVYQKKVLDAALIANEMEQEKMRLGKEVVVFKIDFEKSYAHMDCRFLDHA